MATPFPKHSLILHKKSGGVYVISKTPASGLTLESTGEPAYEYRPAHQMKPLWVRSATKTEDGRFEATTLQTQPFQKETTISPEEEDNAVLTLITFEQLPDGRIDALNAGRSIPGLGMWFYHTQDGMPYKRALSTTANASAPDAKSEAEGSPNGIPLIPMEKVRMWLWITSTGAVMISGWNNRRNKINLHWYAQGAGQHTHWHNEVECAEDILGNPNLEKKDVLKLMFLEKYEALDEYQKSVEFLEASSGRLPVLSNFRRRSAMLHLDMVQGPNRFTKFLKGKYGDIPLQSSKPYIDEGPESEEQLTPTIPDTLHFDQTTPQWRRTLNQGVISRLEETKEVLRKEILPHAFKKNPSLPIGASIQLGIYILLEDIPEENVEPFLQELKVLAGNKWSKWEEKIFINLMNPAETHTYPVGSARLKKQLFSRELVIRTQDKIEPYGKPGQATPEGYPLTLAESIPLWKEIRPKNIERWLLNWTSSDKGRLEEPIFTTENEIQELAAGITRAIHEKEGPSSFLTQHIDQAIIRKMTQLLTQNIIHISRVEDVCKGVTSVNETAATGFRQKIIERMV